MKYVAAYLLVALSGKEQPTREDVEAVLSSVGANVDKHSLDEVINGLKGKKLHEVINEGSKKLSTMSFGSGGGSGSGDGGKKGGDAKKEEPKKDEGKGKKD